MDGITAEFLFTNNQSKEIFSRIINIVKGINRVLYDFRSKFSGNIEWELLKKNKYLISFYLNL